MRVPPFFAFGIDMAQTSVIIYPESTTNLGSSATFTGSAKDFGTGGVPADFTFYRASAYSSSAGTLYIDFSADGTNWYPALTQAVTAAAAQNVVVPITARFYRTRFVNSASAQTAFLLASSCTTN